MTIMQTDLPYLSRDPDRHGNDRVYVRRNGKRIRIREDEGTPAFAKAYADAVERLGARRGKRAATPPTMHPKGSLGWLATEYFKSKGADGFTRLSKESQRARRNGLEECFRVPFSDTVPAPMGNCPLRYLSAQAAKRMIEVVDGLGAQTNRRKHLSTLCSWGVEHGHLPSNPVRDVKAGTKTKGGGYYTWTTADVQQFLAQHQRGSKARLALALLLFTGARRQDMVTFGKQHVKRGLAARCFKEIISYSPCGDLTFLQTATGKPFAPAGFGNWFRDRCDEAGLPLCTAHGLKKAGATIAAENGATTRQLMAMFDWTTVSMAEIYTRRGRAKAARW